jgi:hypothetical protein
VLRCLTMAMRAKAVAVTCRVVAAEVILTHCAEVKK